MNGNRRTAACLVVVCAATLGCASPPPIPERSVVSPMLADRGEIVPGPRGADPSRCDVAQLLDQPLDVDGCVRISLLCSPQVREAFEEFGVTYAEASAAVLPDDPSLGIGLRFPDGGDGRTIWDLDVVQDVVAILFAPLQQSISDAQRAEARLALAARLYDHAGEVRRAFVALQVAERKAELLTQIAASADGSADFAVRVHEAGNLSELRTLRERLPSVDARMAVADSDVALVRAGERLHRALGLRSDERGWSVVAGPPGVPPTDVLPDDPEREAVLCRLELALAREVAERTRAEAVRAHARARPGVEAVGAVSERDTDGTWSAGPRVELVLPLTGRRATEAQAAAAMARRADAQLEAVALAIRSDTRVAVTELSAARRRVAYLRDVVVPLHDRVVELSLREYNYMLLGTVQLLEDKREQLRSYLAYLDAIGDYWIARADLEAAIGRRFASSNERPVPPAAPAQQEPAHEHHHADR